MSVSDFGELKTSSVEPSHYFPFLFLYSSGSSPSLLHFLVFSPSDLSSSSIFFLGRHSLNRHSLIIGHWSLVRFPSSASSIIAHSRGIRLTQNTNFDRHSLNHCWSLVARQISK